MEFSMNDPVRDVHLLSLVRVNPGGAVRACTRVCCAVVVT